jgi:polyferredoxin
MNALVITLTGAQLFGIVVLAALLGGTWATLMPHFLAWTDLRMAERRIRKVFPDATVINVPRQRRSAER